MPGVWLLPVVIVAAVLATKEVLDLLAAAGMQPAAVGRLSAATSCWSSCTWLAMCGSVGCSFDSRHAGIAWRRSADVAGHRGVAVFAVFFAEMCRYRKPGGNTANIAAGVFALRLRRHDASASPCCLRLVWGIGALAAWIIVVKMGDTGAYTVGRLIGRHKMAPLISPGKTIEGAVGALAFSCLGVLGRVPLAGSACRARIGSPGPWWGWIVFGLLVGAAGMLGDLAESLLKRDVGVKDSSTWMPGFGGVLDILDSLLLSAPVAWFCWASGLVGR